MTTESPFQPSTTVFSTQQPADTSSAPVRAQPLAHLSQQIQRMLILCIATLCITPITYRFWRTMYADRDLISTERERIVTDDAVLSPIAFFTRLAGGPTHTVLVIKGNDYVRTLPETLGSVTGVEILFIANNPIRTIPQSIARLSALNHLLIQNTRLTTIPTGIGDLSALTILSLQGNKINTLPDVFSSLHKLETLNLAYNELTDIPSSVLELPNLILLDLTGNNLRSFPEKLPPKLGVLYIGDNPIPPKELEAAQFKYALSDVVIYY